MLDYSKLLSLTAELFHSLSFQIRRIRYISVFCSNILKPNGYVMHQQV